jgi:hypothetical protein
VGPQDRARPGGFQSVIPRREFGLYLAVYRSRALFFVATIGRSSANDARTGDAPEATRDFKRS